MRRLMISAALTAAVAAAGCGSGKDQRAQAAQRRYGALAHKCRASALSVETGLKESVKLAAARGLHGSVGEAARALETQAGYEEAHHRRVRCAHILVALISSAEDKKSGLKTP